MCFLARPFWKISTTSTMRIGSLIQLDWTGDAFITSYYFFFWSPISNASGKSGCRPQGHKAISQSPQRAAHVLHNLQRIRWPSCFFRDCFCTGAVCEFKVCSLRRFGEMAFALGRVKADFSTWNIVSNAAQAPAVMSIILFIEKITGLFEFVQLINSLLLWAKIVPALFLPTTLIHWCANHTRSTRSLHCTVRILHCSWYNSMSNYVHTGSEQRA